VSGVAYKNDPAIFSWQLCNEPRDREYGGDGTVLYNWINEMAGFVKSLDPNHMVSTGEEGGGTSGNFDPHGPVEGVDFQRNTACPYIDYACIHLYPSSWGKWDDAKCDTYLENRRRIAHDVVGKPIALEEFGVITSFGEKDPHFLNWLMLITNPTNDFDGFNPWQMDDLPASSAEEENWDFGFNSPTAAIIEKFAKIQARKSGGLYTNVPSSPFGQR